MKLNFKLETETAKMPTKHTPRSAGIDFYAAEKGLIFPGKSLKISTGVSWNPSVKQYNFTLCMIIQSRSGLAFNKDIEASNAGVIDEDYINTPERKAIINVKLYNTGPHIYEVKIGEKICQGILHLVPIPKDIKYLDDTRNGKGFGSSDEKEK